MRRSPGRPGRSPRCDRKSSRLNSSHANISYAVFFFNKTASMGIYTLSLHAPLPIWSDRAVLAIPPTATVAPAGRHRPTGQGRPMLDDAGTPTHDTGAARAAVEEAIARAARQVAPL